MSNCVVEGGDVMFVIEKYFLKSGGVIEVVVKTDLSLEDHQEDTLQTILDPEIGALQIASASANDKSYYLILTDEIAAYKVVKAP